MKVLYFDCFSGISGDMTVGALLDLGIDKDLFIEELRKLNLGGYEVRIDKTTKQGISGTDFNVIVNEEYDDLVKRMERNGHIKCDVPVEQISDNDCEISHEHNHSHDNQQYNDSDNGQAHKHDHHDHCTRNLMDIEALIDASNLKKSIKNMSKRVFREIARAEAKVHNKSINEIYFHEVGAVDSIVDIVGTAICLDLLGVKDVYCSPLHDGQGFKNVHMGVIPSRFCGYGNIANSHILWLLKMLKLSLLHQQVPGSKKYAGFRQHACL